MSDSPKPVPGQFDEPTRSHVDAAETPTSEWRPGAETTSEAIAENALGAQLDRYLAGLEMGHRQGSLGGPEAEQLRIVVDQLHELSRYLGPTADEAAAPSQ